MGVLTFILLISPGVVNVGIPENELPMANKLLIVHGYSDGSTSFTALGDFLVRARGLPLADLFYLDYSSMDDQATFHDFADKLDTDHRLRLNGQRVDVICHSTGSLVVRAWLALHAERNRRRRLG